MPPSPRTFSLHVIRPLLFLAIVFTASAAEPLQKLEGCTLVEADWADGDSFRIRTAAGKEHTVRLYGADCIEATINDTTDARRLRAQRRYFGLSGYGGSAQASIQYAKQLGMQATDRREELLEKPFTVHTTFADARGDGKFKRIYGFVTTADGKDLAAVLVREGLARAYGVYRETPTGKHADDYRAQLADLELLAARKGRGAWQLTDWETLPAERQAERDEEANLEAAIDGGAELLKASINPNTAARDELMRLPGIGEKTANAIIEHRPFSTLEELDRVPGIGPKTLERITPYTTLDP
jgi:competence ComEA-like helix-hairpin-helix protein